MSFRNRSSIYNSVVFRFYPDKTCTGRQLMNFLENIILLVRLLPYTISFSRYLYFYGNPKSFSMQ